MFMFLVKNCFTQMHRNLISRTLVLLLSMLGGFSLFVSEFASAEIACEKTNADLQAMKEAKVSFRFEDGDTKEISVLLADTNQTRAAGFQRVCESTIEAKPILFFFESPIITSFHMNNVVAPIDIAFIDQDGRIDSFHAMQTYVLGSTSKPLYRSKGRIVAALEVRPGFYSENNIDITTVVSWTLPEK